MEPLNDQNLLKLLRSRWPDRDILSYHIKKANKAAKSVKLNLVADKQPAAIADMQIVISEVEQLNLLINDLVVDDNRTK